MATPRLRRNDTALLIVDMQDRLVPAMREPEALVMQVGRLLDGAAALELPVLVTEQYPKGLGHTVSDLTDRLAQAHCRAEKTVFSGCIDEVREALAAAGTSCVAVAGIEAHVCLMQSCLDLQAHGFIVGAVLDATSSRHARDQQTAEQRLMQAGVMPLTVESALMELTGGAGDPAFKPVQQAIK